MGGAEIVSYDPLTRRAFVVNAAQTTADGLVANEGEPNANSLVDPDRSERLIDLRRGVSRGLAPPSRHDAEHSRSQATNLARK